MHTFITKILEHFRSWVDNVETEELLEVRTESKLTRQRKTKERRQISAHTIDLRILLLIEFYLALYWQHRDSYEIIFTPEDTQEAEVISQNFFSHHESVKYFSEIFFCLLFSVLADPSYQNVILFESLVIEFELQIT